MTDIFDVWAGKQASGMDHRGTYETFEEANAMALHYVMEDCESVCISQRPAYHKDALLGNIIRSFGVDGWRRGQFSVERSEISNRPFFRRLTRRNK